MMARELIVKFLNFENDTDDKVKLETKMKVVRNISDDNDSLLRFRE